MEDSLEMSHKISKLVPENLQALGLNLIDANVVGDQIYSVLVRCAELLFGQGKELAKATQDIEDLSQFLLHFTWERLHMGDWKDIALSWRYLYSYASFFRVLGRLQSQTEKVDLQELVCLCDMGLLMGAPVLENILSKIASVLSKEIQLSVESNQEWRSRIVKKPCLARQINSAKGIATETCPSLEKFLTAYHGPQKPVLIRDSLQDWPALTTKQWNLEYILQVAGCRTVPVEIGSKYTDDNWSQKLMTVKEFADMFILSNSPEGVGYCAQHQLLDQISELSEDIGTPLYCCGGENAPDIHCWFGPGGTVSPLHFDPKDNCLVQVFGEKYVCLFSPEETPRLYPHDSHLLNNTSQVDFEDPDQGRFPLFSGATYQECILKPGDLLFIPKKWWHFVRSLDTSFSVSFWW